MKLQQAVLIEDDSQVGEARRVASMLSSAAGFSDTEAGKVAILVNELGTNIRKHARHGELLLRELSAEGTSGIEVLAVDRGPGMDLEKSLRDGHSTAGTRGEGLGAVRRVAHEFDAFSAPGHGAVVMGRVWARSMPVGNVQVGAVSVPLQGEPVCGDAWELNHTTSVVRLLVADGLGHGPLAARASGTAVEVFASQAVQRLPGPEAILHALHAGLKSTRGAALAVAELDLVSRTLRFGGIGNIGASLDTGDARPRGLVSHNGTAGHEARRVQEFAFPWPSRALLVMHSDGIATQWKIESYSGLHGRHASVIAGVLYRDFRRKNDDATVVVIKEP